MAKETLIIDNTFLSNWVNSHYASMPNTDAQARIIADRLKGFLSDLSRNYNLKITDMVVHEATNARNTSLRSRAMNVPENSDGENYLSYI